MSIVALDQRLWSCSLAGTSRVAESRRENKDVSTTMIYTHVLNRSPGAVRSPADSLIAVTDEPPRPMSSASCIRDTLRVLAGYHLRVDPIPGQQKARNASESTT